MSFQIFLGFIVTCYLCYYLGTVAYDLLVKVEDLSKDGENSELGSLLAKWKEFDPERGDISP